jgi:hypothetical protein
VRRRFAIAACRIAAGAGMSHAETFGEGSLIRCKGRPGHECASGTAFIAVGTLCVNCRKALAREEARKKVAAW